MAHASHLALAFVLTGIASSSALAAEPSERVYDARRPVGHAVPDCTEPGLQHLLRCEPRVRIPVIPNVGVANDLFGFGGRPRRPYRQLFTWDR